MSTKKGYIFGVLIALSWSGVLLVVWNFLTLTTTISRRFIVLGAFALLTSLALTLFGASLPKEDIRRGTFIVASFPGVFSGIGCLLLVIAPAGTQQTQHWALMFLGLASFISYQILVLYAFLKARRRQT